jgi:hypothetical protein
MQSQKFTKTLHFFQGRTGYVSDKWASYFSIYDLYFYKFRNKKINLLEIGVQNGGSLEAWSKFFKSANIIIGSDIDLRCKNLKFKSKKIKLVVGDINRRITRKKIIDLAQGFDIIIDDGSHKSHDINNTFLFFYPYLNPGGVYLIEDLHCSYWKRYGGGLLQKQSSIDFLKLFVDVLNFESWGMAFKRLSSLRFGYPGTKKSIQVNKFCNIESIHFHNSICVIIKGSEPNTIGERSVTGKKALVHPNLPKSGSSFQLEPQRIKKSLFN